MITNEYGIHTFSLKLQCKYSETRIEHILRLELRFGRSKITKLTKSKDWESQLVELGSQVEMHQHKFLHRLHMTREDQEKAAPYREKSERLRFARSRSEGL